MVTDPISDLLVRLRNGFRRHHDVVTIPASKLKHEVLRVLQAEGFIQGIETATEDGHAVLKVALRYVSKPGRRVYVGTREIPRVRNGIGMAILSTSKGIMTDQASRKAGLGGEVLCAVW
jgi:small subunit ribosomal protein S8